MRSAGLTKLDHLDIVASLLTITSIIDLFNNKDYFILSRDQSTLAEGEVGWSRLIEKSSHHYSLFFR